MSKTIADPTLLATHMAELADKRIDILRRIGDVGSISEAARRAGVSYKAAWQAIETLNNLAGALWSRRSWAATRAAAPGSRPRAKRC